MSASNFIFPWTGRKKKFENDIAFKHINLDDISTIVEPFSGSMSFSQYLYMIKDNTDLHYVYNDYDTNMYNFIKYIHDEGLDGLKALCEISNKHEPKRDKSVRNEVKSVQDFFNAKARGEDSAFLKKVNKNAEQYEKHVEFIQQLDKITNKNYKDIFDKYINRSDVLLYLDPPYFKSYNSDYMTQNDETIDMTKILVDIVDLFKNAKCHIIYVHNKNALMDYLFSDFPAVEEYVKTYQTTKKKCIHQVRAK